MVENIIKLDDLRLFEELDSLEVNEEYDKHSQNKDGIINCFEENLQFKNGWYKPILFWKLTTEGLRNNFEITKKDFVPLKY